VSRSEDDASGTVPAAAHDSSATPAVPGTSDSPDAPRERRRRRLPRIPTLPLWQEAVLVLVGAVVLAVVLKTLVLQAFYIPSESMQPGLEKDDRILVQKVSYWFGGSPDRGDVVVFEDPGGWLGAGADTGLGGVQSVLATIGLYPEGGHLVKRVIGVPGDVIVCCDRQGRIEVNGKALDEDDYLAEVTEDTQSPCDGPARGNCRWRAGPVPDGTVFVMGDNRQQSSDSSAYVCVAGETECTSNPFVDDDLIVGKVFAVVWPADRFGGVGTPDSFDDVQEPE
jgi:signal peptidase I